MIYVSTAYSGNNDLKESIRILSENGFKNIELSGSFDRCDELEKDLISLKDKYNLNYLCHNYFPGTKQPFVLNMASLNDEIYKRSLSHFKNLIKLSKKLNSPKVGFHAGFFVDITSKEIGSNLNVRTLFNRKKSLKRFCEGFNELKDMAGALELYLENNVISHANFKAFGNANPLMLTSYNDFVELKEVIDFKLLLDIGHLKVSAVSLGLDFEDELNKMMSVSDYLHCSDNDGLSDQNKPLLVNSKLFQQLKNYPLNGKTITLEIGGGMENIKNCCNLLVGMC
jgi:sugar phosphate isomerase/epimerase